jgi:hypothetical protein
MLICFFKWLKLNLKPYLLFKKNLDVSRPGVHAKTKTSSLKTSKLYKKSYRGQGR